MVIRYKYEHFSLLNGKIGYWVIVHLNAHTVIYYEKKFNLDDNLLNKTNKKNKNDQQDFLLLPLNAAGLNVKQNT